MSSGKIAERKIKDVLRDCAKENDLDPEILFKIYEVERGALSQRRRHTIFNDLKRIVTESIKSDQVEN